MWHDYSPPNQPNTVFSYMSGPISIMMQKHDDGFFYVSCSLLGIVNNRVDPGRELRNYSPACQIRAVRIVLTKAAELCNICNEAIALVQ